MSTQPENESLWAAIGQFAMQAKDLRAHCTNEEQTKLSLINPYIELLGKNVRDPREVKVEYQTGIGKAPERVDYAIFEGGEEVLLIEAKSVGTQLSMEPTPQLRRYAQDKAIPFAAYTNGVEWHWYRMEGHRLGERPFLRNNVCQPNRSEVQWLQTIKNGLNEPSATRIAQKQSLQSEIQNWVNDHLRTPPEDFLRLILKAVNIRATADNLLHAEAAWTEAYDNHLKQKIETVAGEVLRPKDPSPIPDPAPDNPKLFASPQKCEYKPQGNTNWIEVNNATALLLELLQWCADNHRQGPDAYYHSVANILIRGNPFILPMHKSYDKKSYSSKTDKNGWRIFNCLNNTSKKKAIETLCKACVRKDGSSPILGRDIEIKMPNVS